MIPSITSLLLQTIGLIKKRACLQIPMRLSKTSLLFVDGNLSVDIMKGGKQTSAVRPHNLLIKYFEYYYCTLPAI